MDEHDLTNGIQKNVSWWTPDSFATYTGPLWELDPVEVRARPVPTPRVETLPAIEGSVFNQENVDVETFRTFLRDNGLALIVSRNITQRDRADRQQPFNLKVPGGAASIATGGQVYASSDSGDNWMPIVRDLPAVLSVEVQSLP